MALIITAFSIDYGFERWVEKAIKFYVSTNDLIIFISVSGNSQNLINGLKFAKSCSIASSSLNGYKDNNYLKRNADFSLWVNSKAYNIVESIHTIWLTLIIDLLIGSPEYPVS